MVDRGGAVDSHSIGGPIHWLKFNLTGTGSNRDAIGAKVRVLATIRGHPIWQMREVSGGGAVQDDSRPSFGLGDATVADRVIIEWPSGARQHLANVNADQILTASEPPALKAAVQPDGGCVLNIRAEPNRAWQIQASSNLAAWQTLATLTNTTLAFQYTDTGAVGVASRFYRVGSE